MKQEKSDARILMTACIILMFCAAIVVICLFVFRDSGGNSPGMGENSQTVNSFPPGTKNCEPVLVNGKVYYRRLNEKTWEGQYFQDSILIDHSIRSYCDVVSWSEYCSIVDELNEQVIDEEYLEIKTMDGRGDDYQYVILCMGNGYSWCSLEIVDYEETNDGITIYGDEDVYGTMACGSAYLIVIPTKMPAGTPIDYRECYSSDEISNLERYGYTINPYDTPVDKPVIYLYPEEETEISVTLRKPELLTCFYPDYQDGWRVIAAPDGTLTDCRTGRTLYSLYYESRADVSFSVEEEGFVVRGEDAASFLEDKLAVLGLNEKESEEFIIYWLPKLQAHPYNYIRFASQEEIEENMPLQIEPAPDTAIRILMTFKGLDEPIHVKEQSLSPVSRAGFTAVEWGGAELP